MKLLKCLKSIKMVALALCVSMLCLGGASVTANAEEDYYNRADYETRSGYWVMDNYHGHDQHVTLYLLTEPNVNYTSYKLSYPFICYSHISPAEETDELIFMTEIYTPNGTEITDLCGGTVYSYTFGIKDGDYCFSFPSGNDLTLILTQDFQSPQIGSGYYTWEDGLNGTNYEIVTVGKGESIRLYGLCGSDQWVSDFEASAQFDEFVEWAKATEESFQFDDGSGSTEAVSEETTEELNSEETSASENIEEVSNKAENKIETIDVQDSEGENAILIGMIIGLSVLGIVAIGAIAVVILVVLSKRK